MTEIMRKYLSFLLVASGLFALTSCGEVNPVSPVDEPEIQTPTEYILNAFLDDSAITKTALGSNGRSVEWREGDKIMAFPRLADPLNTESCSRYESNAANIISPGNATFTFGDVGDDELVFAIYPSSAVEEEGYSYSCVVFRIPENQVATPDSFDPAANVAYGKISQDDSGPQVKFQNIGALLSVSIKNPDITSVTLTVDGEQSLVGRAWEVLTTETDDDNNVISEFNPRLNVIEKDKLSVTLSSSSSFEVDKDYYFVVYPGEYSNISLIFSRSDGKYATYKSSKALSLERNDNVLLFDQTIPDGKWEDKKSQNIAFETNALTVSTSFYDRPLPELLGAKTKVTYSSSNTDVAKAYVNYWGNPMYYANTCGTAIITAHAEETAEYYGADATLTLTVVEPPLQPAFIFIQPLSDFPTSAHAPGAYNFPYDQIDYMDGGPLITDDTQLYLSSGVYLITGEDFDYLLHAEADEYVGIPTFGKALESVTVIPAPGSVSSTSQFDVFRSMWADAQTIVGSVSLTSIEGLDGFTYSIDSSVIAPEYYYLAIYESCDIIGLIVKYSSEPGIEKLPQTLSFKDPEPIVLNIYNGPYNVEIPELTGDYYSTVSFSSSNTDIAFVEEGLILSTLDYTDWDEGEVGTVTITAHAEETEVYYEANATLEVKVIWGYSTIDFDFINQMSDLPENGGTFHYPSDNCEPSHDPIDFDDWHFYFTGGVHQVDGDEPGLYVAPGSFIGLPIVPGNYYDWVEFETYDGADGANVILSSTMPGLTTAHNGYIYESSWSGWGSDGFPGKVLYLYFEDECVIKHISIDYCQGQENESGTPDLGGDHVHNDNGSWRQQ